MGKKFASWTSAAVVAVAALGWAAVPAGATARAIVGNEVWENGTFLVTEPVVVLPGSSLTIRNAVVDFRVPELCSPIGGTLGYCQPDVTVKPGGRLLVESSTITAPADTWRMWPFFWILGEASIRDNVFERFNGMNFQVTGSGVVSGNEISDMIGEVAAWRGTTPLFEDNWIHDSHGGIGAQDASPTIRGNVLERISGYAIRVQESIVGDKAHVTAPIVEGNVVRDSFEGVFTDSGFPYTISGNRFEGVRYGIVVRAATHESTVHQGTPLVEGNTVIGSRIALYAVALQPIQPRPEPVVVTFRDNSILDTICTPVKAASNANVHVQADARENWWGGASGPAGGGDCPATEGDVLYDPWLTESPV